MHWMLQGRSHNIKAAVLNCDRGYNAATIPSLQAAGLSTQPLSMLLLAQSIFNNTNAAGTAFQWHNTSCIQGSALQPASTSSSTPGCAAEEAACFADLSNHIKQDDDYWFALYIPGNFSTNFAAAFNNASNTGPAYQQMSMNYVYPQVQYPEITVCCFLTSHLVLGCLFIQV